MSVQAHHGLVGRRKPEVPTGKIRLLLAVLPLVVAAAVVVILAVPLLLLVGMVVRVVVLVVPIRRGVRREVRVPPVRGMMVVTRHRPQHRARGAVALARQARTCLLERWEVTEGMASHLVSPEFPWSTEEEAQALSGLVELAAVGMRRLDTSISLMGWMVWVVVVVATSSPIASPVQAATVVW